MTIKVNNVVKDFGEFRALDGVSLDVKKGSLFGLLGPNGSGKSTLIRLMTGQMIPTEGKISISGKNPKKDSISIRRECGIIPEQETPPSFLTGEEYLHFVSDIRGKGHDNISWWVDFLDFDHEKNKLCKDLSRGTRQKLMFSQAFLHEPKTAFIDEPLINLDPIIQSRIKKFLKQKAKSGTTIFLSTHVLEIAQEICSEIAIISKGNIVYDGKVKKDLDEFFLRRVGK